jgi:hypothetical protein
MEFKLKMEEAGHLISAIVFAETLPKLKDNFVDY